MPFVKPFFDVGLFSNQAEQQLQFWAEQVGLVFDHTLKLGGGVLQHRFQADAAVMKVNVAREPLATAGQGPLQHLLVACPGCVSIETLQDPDGNRISRVPPGYQGVQGLAVELQVADLAASTAFYQQVLGLQLELPGVLTCGQGLIFLRQGETVSATTHTELAAVGLRYLTLQVEDCDTAYQHAIACGAHSGRAPVTLGSTARIAFVIDPDGLWIELSERASLTGKAV
ncbi:MAG: VOC family protein [Gammaproteobacteria bacterium HGW-Gammaproteobacteria-11]|nr:MAG: VOC family protein [Gammaproteobacteria bacterium HGW-Gammaproteobacteria-11]